MDDRTRGGHRGLDDNGASDATISLGDPTSDRPTSDRPASVASHSVRNDPIPDDSSPRAIVPVVFASRAAVAKALSRFKPSTRQARQVAMRSTSAAACTESRVLIDGAAERVSSSDRACETHREQISKSRDTIAQTRALIRRLAKLRQS